MKAYVVKVAGMHLKKNAFADAVEKTTAKVAAKKPRTKKRLSEMKRTLTVEWAETPNLWRRETVEYVSTYRNDNYKFTFYGALHIIQSFKEGTSVLRLVGKRWLKVGRVSCGTVFIGDGQSYAEFCRTPAGLKAAEELLQSLRAR